MPIFSEQRGILSTLKVVDFAKEKELQNLIEGNLFELFGCAFVATEFSTGSVHGGRIDTLAISEDGNPVIIEYKKIEDAKLINQALFYLDWIKDHQGDFAIAAKKTLGDIEINWNHIRVICVAPSYDKFALHAVKHMGASVELWQYNRHEGGLLELREIFRNSDVALSKTSPKTPREKFAGDSVVKPSFSFQGHLEKASAETQVVARELSEFICSLDASVIEVPQKLYVAYKLAKNIACMEVHKKEVLITLPLKFEADMPAIARDLTGIGHWGTGDLELRVKDAADVETACEIIRRSYLENGGS
jgi:predicted transport protein